MRHLFALALAALALVAVPGALAAGPDLGTTGTLDAGKVTYTAAPAHSKTSLAVRAADGHIIRQASLRGAWGFPRVTLNGDAAGLTRDGRLLVLAEVPTNRASPLRSDSRFVTVDTRRLAVTRSIRLRGDFGFDALSPNGRTLYLIEHFSEADLSRYRVRAYDLKTRHLLRGAITDPRDAAEPMSGFPAARLTAAGGRRVYTLYSSAEHPFVHALDTVSRTAVCIDLPSVIDRIELATMRLSDGGRILTIVGPVGPRFVVDTKTFRVT
jgi:hypothetical protein